MRWLLAAGLLLLAGLAGCVDDSDGPNNGTATTAAPGSGAHGLPETVAGMEFVTNADANSTQGIWVEDGIAYLSGGPGLRILDVSTPSEPRLLAEAVETTTGSRDVDLLHHPDGRTYAVLAKDGGGIAVIDVTDPDDPRPVSQVDIFAHNIAVVPGSTLVYSSRSTSVHVPDPGTTGQVDIVDLAEPAEPAVSVFQFPAAAMAQGAPKPVTATTCHDITFEPEKDWALCAGISETHVWDITDPAAPEIIQVVTWPGNQIHHAAWSARGGELLIIGDEFGGAIAGPACSEAPNPYAALWFVDISDLATPVPLGYYQVSYDSAAEDNTALCTTHFGTLVEDRDLFVIGWYTAGTALVDFSDPSAPVEVAHYRPDGAVNTWEARYHDGHVYTGDTQRGMDVLRLV